MQKLNGRVSSQGFSSIELLTILTIAVILTSLAVPGFSHLIQKIRLSSATDELHHAIHLARSEAIKGNKVAKIIASNQNWKNGWYVVNSSNQTIMTHGPFPKELNVNAKFSDGTQQIVFNGAGHTRSNDSRNLPQFGHIQLTLGKSSRIIMINFLGHTRVCNPDIDRSCMVSRTEQAKQ